MIKKLSKKYIIAIAFSAVLFVVAIMWPTARDYYSYLIAPKNIHIKQTEQKNFNSEKLEDIVSLEKPEIIITTAPNKKENKEKTNEKEALSETVKNNKTNEDKDEALRILPNYINWGFESPEKRNVSAIIIHSSYDALGNDPYKIDGLLAEYKIYGVAPHYVIDRQGNIFQLVKNENIAYHAGQSQLPNKKTNVNEISIGIELMNKKNDNYTPKQYHSLRTLIKKLKYDYPTIEYTLGHNDIAPDRKTDPWNFNWKEIKN